MNNSNKNYGFTLLELLIVLGILAILAVIVLLVINPAEFLRRTRDVKRQTDLQTLNQAIANAAVIDYNLNLGTTSTVYLSLPDNSSSTCGSLGLPNPPVGWQYHCVTSANLQRTDGNGWLPVNFNNLSTGSPLSNLPIDPVNASSSGLFYSYTPGGSWELTGTFESDKFKNLAAIDGGPDPTAFEVGTDLNLSPFLHGMVGWWKFDEGTGISTADFAGAHPGTLTGGTSWTTGKFGNAVNLTGNGQYVSMGGKPSDYGTLDNFTFSAWVKRANTTGASPQGIQGFGQGTGDAWLVFTNDTGIVWVAGNMTNYGYAYIVMAGAGTLPLNQWMHVIFTYSSTAGGKIYINGSLAASGSTNPGVLNRDAGTLTIGAWAGSPTFYFPGAIDDVKIFKKALTQDEVQHL